MGCFSALTDVNSTVSKLSSISSYIERSLAYSYEISHNQKEEIPLIAELYPNRIDVTGNYQGDLVERAVLLADLAKLTSTKVSTLVTKLLTTKGKSFNSSIAPKISSAFTVGRNELISIASSLVSVVAHESALTIDYSLSDALFDSRPAAPLQYIEVLRTYNNECIKSDKLTIRLDDLVKTFIDAEILGTLVRTVLQTSVFSTLVTDHDQTSSLYSMGVNVQRAVNGYTLFPGLSKRGDSLVRQDVHSSITSSRVKILEELVGCDRSIEKYSADISYLTEMLVLQAQPGSNISGQSAKADKIIPVVSFDDILATSSVDVW